MHGPLAVDLSALSPERTTHKKPAEVAFTGLLMFSFEHLAEHVGSTYKLAL